MNPSRLNDSLGIPFIATIARHAVIILGQPRLPSSAQTYLPGRRRLALAASHGVLVHEEARLASTQPKFLHPVQPCDGQVKLSLASTQPKLLHLVQIWRNG